MNLIDRDALIDALDIAEDCSICRYDNHGFCTKGSEFVNACVAIFDQPTITIPQWIPVTERLPEKCKYYLVTDDGYVEEAYLNSDRKWWTLQGDKLKDVTAWTPLPEPWKGEEDERRR